MEGPATSGSSSIANVASPSWKYRRIVIYSSLVLDALTIGTILVGWLAGRNPMAAISVIAGLTIAKDAAIIGSYVFGAAWTDISAMKHFSNIGDSIGEIVQSTRRI